MRSTPEWSAMLRMVDTDEWPRFVEAASGLPGPRANLALVAAAAQIAGSHEIDALLGSGGEFAAMCAAAAVGRRSFDPVEAARARALAVDGRWRVREGVVIGLQLWGDVDRTAVAELATRWATDTNPLVQRAAVAAICEPRLLDSPEMAARAVAICAVTTEDLVARPLPERRRGDVRVLRQTLGYAWSVAVAADPAPGLRAFDALDGDDPDLVWIVRDNGRKKRLSSLRTSRSQGHEQA